MAITNRIGSPVTGEDFFGRKQELARAHRYLDERQSLLLSAPRRIGKTSMAKRLLDEKAKQGWKCVYIDLQGIMTKEGFLRNFIGAFMNASLIDRAGKKVKELFSSIFDSIDGVEIGKLKIDLHRRDNLEMMYTRIAETFDYTHDTIIVIDELPLFLGKLIGEDNENRDDVEFLLNWFRSLRQHEHSHLRWIFCGSVGLRNFTIHHRMSQAINDLVDFELGELSNDEAKGLIKELAISYNLSMDDTLIAHTLDCLQWPIPYFIQLLMDRLILKNSNPNGKMESNDVEEAIEALSRTDYFATWDERLAEYRNLETIARLILDNLSVNEAGLSEQDIIMLVMKGRNSDEEPEAKREVRKVADMLVHDGYILRQKSEMKFRSPLLRKWWKYKFA